jgi:hypothetical protein
VKRVLFIVGALLVAMAGATVITRLSGSNDPRNDFSDAEPLANATILQSGAGWVLEQADGCGFRIRIGTKATLCSSGPFADGSGMSTLLQGEGHHFVLMVRGARVAPRIRFFSSTIFGTEIPVHALPGNEYIAVVDLGSAEAYGAQYLTQDGTLISADSFVTGTR